MAVLRSRTWNEADCRGLGSTGRCLADKSGRDGVVTERFVFGLIVDDA